ncbi:ATP-dependent DNA ligase [Candidatus Bathyarchaeota archaeon]|nr:ATP-dependent DNA ligase [Candidatus Bathyarchaeota archaeon]
MAGETAFLELARLFEALEETTKRNEKKALISSFLKRLGEEEIQPAVSFLTGRVFPEADPRILEVGERTIWEIMKDNKQTLLIKKKITILEAMECFNEISKMKGKGSRRKKQNLTESLLNQATSLEKKYFIRLLLGEMRIGVVEGVTLGAIADTSSIELSLVIRANMLLGNLGKVAKIALKRGIEDLKNVNLTLFQPIKPMLAEMSYDLEEVFSKHEGQTGFEYKYDGARVQIHLKKDKVKIFSRSLKDVTMSIPEIVELVKKQINAEDALLEGEVVAYGTDNKPLPFQYLMRRFRRIHQIEVMIREVPLKLYLFDVLYLNEELLIDKPYNDRRRLLSTICKPDLLVERLVTANISEAKDFFEKALKHGHEGLMAKALNSDYTPGKRGKKWFKIKPVETLDLVITAADWGYGRRRGWLSNYHLAARDEEKGEYLNLGKTFKGLTDNEFFEITNHLQKIKTKENRYTVYVEPKIVVEVAFNEIQKSRNYKAGFALRFARINRIRYDKHPENADTITRIRELYEKQFKFKAKLENTSLKKDEMKDK